MFVLLTKLFGDANSFVRAMHFLLLILYNQIFIMFNILFIIYYYLSCLIFCSKQIIICSFCENICSPVAEINYLILKLFLKNIVQNRQV